MTTISNQPNSSSPSSVVSDSTRVMMNTNDKEYKNSIKQQMQHPQQMMSSVQKQQQQLPFYCQGGMIVNLIGIVINLIIPIYVMINIYNDTNDTTNTNNNMTAAASTLLTTQRRYHTIYLLLLSWFVSIFTLRSKTTYCILVVPTYIVSFIILIPLLCQQYTVYTIMTMIFWTAVMAFLKITICMSICMHRYSSHAAFKCGPITNIALLLLGCVANQGGPLWWASQHRCHHKFCELPRDPHSPKQVGTERAFAFFLERYNVEEEFVPRHIQFYGLRVLDTWAFLVVSLELWLSYQLVYGNYGLFIAFTSGWLSQTISLWFNVANHPILEKKDGKNVDVCTATDEKADLESTWYVPFHVLDRLVPYYSYLAMEDNHEHHHNHANLAKRSEYDIGYYIFIQPLKYMGLLWNVVVK